MIRIVLAASFLAIAASAAALAGDNTAPVAPSLKQNVVVTGEFVRIGDLIENAGAAAHTPVFRAPDLGSTGAVPVQHVVEAVRAHNVFAVDTRGLTEISVTRASRAIGIRDIEARIAQVLAAQYRLGEAKNLGITFDREVPTLQAEPATLTELTVTRLSFDPRSGRFDITLDLPGSASVRRGGLRYTGIAAETYEIAVATRPLARGEVLRASDVAIERRPKTDLSADSLFEAAAAVGLSVRQPLRAGAPLRRADLAKPDLVQRNEPVMLIFDAPGISLTLRGTAQESGTEGDIINVLNPQSKRSVQGIVSGPGRVTVSGMKPRVTASLAQSARHPETGTVRRRPE